MTNQSDWYVAKLLASVLPRGLWLMAWFTVLTAIAYVVLLLFVPAYRPTTFSSWLLFSMALLPVAWLADSASARDRRSLGEPEAAIGLQPLPSTACAPIKRRLFERATPASTI